MKAVNLLPQDQRTKSLRVKPTKKGLVGLGVVVAFAGVGYWGFSIHQSVGQADQSLADARSEQTELQTQVGAYAAAEARAADEQRAKGLVVGLAQQRVNWERIMRDTATVMPKQTWLDGDGTGLTAQSPSIDGSTTTTVAAPATSGGSGSSGTTSASTASSVPVAATGGPATMHLSGFAMDNHQVALLLVRLGSVSGLGEPTLTSSKAEPKGGRRVIHFEIDIPVDQRAQDRPVLSTTSSAPISTSVQP
jgi:Tfp pilus assembly protein PilN